MKCAIIYGVAEVVSHSWNEELRGALQTRPEGLTIISDWNEDTEDEPTEVTAVIGALVSQIEETRAMPLDFSQLQETVLKEKFFKFADYFKTLKINLKKEPPRLFLIMDSYLF